MGKGYRPEKRAYQPEQPDELPSGPAPEPPPGTRTGKSEPDDQLLREIGKAVVERVDEEGYSEETRKVHVGQCPHCMADAMMTDHTDDCPLAAYVREERDE